MKGLLVNRINEEYWEDEEEEEEEEEGRDEEEDDDDINLPYVGAAAFMFPLVEWYIPFNGTISFLAQPYNLYEFLGWTTDSI